ncbi:uncharacterized protein ARMOST_02197 [Armillaria ostoyae]|uniref:Uncharacterized protein n=1 Tax=Armillaria ostoyae TaxID=47428 RepID=A0A284QR91_ARMOS|nr:uncharacterized protein ARMOST_02197 [Armillaria ostoyae]
MDCPCKKVILKAVGDSSRMYAATTRKCWGTDVGNCIVQLDDILDLYLSTGAMNESATLPSLEPVSIARLLSVKHLHQYEEGMLCRHTGNRSGLLSDEHIRETTVA